MRQLTDDDLIKMDRGDFNPDDRAVKKQIRDTLKLSQLIPHAPVPVPKNARLDLHQKTEEQAWDAINILLRSGTRNAQVITGASGILKVKFMDWITNGTLADKIVSWKLINNGCYEIKIKRAPKS